MAGNCTIRGTHNGCGTSVHTATNMSRRMPAGGRQLLGWKKRTRCVQRIGGWGGDPAMGTPIMYNYYATYHRHTSPSPPIQSYPSTADT